jgi:hypothetical protein
MVDCERWTLTHSSGWAAELLELGLAPGLAVVEASSDAVAVAEVDVWDDDGKDEADCDGEADCEGDAVGALLGLAAEAEAVEGPADTEAVGGAAGDGDGEGVGEVDGDDVGEGVGEGEVEGVLEGGSTWQLVLVFAAVPRLDVVVTGPRTPARAVPGKLASTPKVREPPASSLSAVTRPCAKRIRIALSTLLVRVTFVLSVRFGDN